MRILLAPDSFKHSLSARKVCIHLTKGIHRVFPDFEVISKPMADGGEGTVESLVTSTKGRINQASVHNPLMRKIRSFYGILGDGETAVIEMSAASGIELINSKERNPWLTTTFGTGELIKAALDEGCRKFIIGIGGSATNDGGAGMLLALGAKLFNESNEELPQGGGALRKLHSIDISSLDERLKESKFRVACDVTNPLVGPKGASFVYGPQKGADPDMANELDKCLTVWGNKIKEFLGVDVLDLPGAGAAGGIGAALFAFFNAELLPGFEIISNAASLEEEIKQADLVITGEGKLDFQTQFGKTPHGVAELAKKHNIPVIAVSGTLGDNYQDLYNKGFAVITSIIDKPMTLDQALSATSDMLADTGERLMRLFKISQNILKN
jgi:glycerate kinase